LKYAPKLTFKMDKSFETADRINTLLNQPEVRRDIVAEPEDESGEEE